jgi:hypothetical protein
MPHAKRFLFALLLLAIAGCTEIIMGEDPKGTAENTFESFWHGIDDTWPEFESKHTNWDSVYAVYRPQVTASTTDIELRGIFAAMLPVLKDGHTDVYPNSKTTIGYYPPFPRNYFGFTWIVQKYGLFVRGNNSMVYGFFGPDIGYIYIANFAASADKYTIIDDILKEFKNVKGIIIDVRNNGGGNSLNSKNIASRFADKTNVYEYVRFRINSQTKDLGDFWSGEIAPAGPSQFKGKVAVLTNRYSFSATEDFVLMMKSFPNVTLIGDNTGGGSGTRPVLKELPNGWTYRVSSTLLSGVDKVPITNGIAPHIRISLSKTDSLNGKDPIIETAKNIVLN